MATTASPYTTAMSATPAGVGPLIFFLQHLFLHSVGTVAHVLLALAVAGRMLFRRCRLSSAGRAKDKEVRGGTYHDDGGGFQCHGLAVSTTWGLAAAEVLLTAYSCYMGVGAGWSLDAFTDLMDVVAAAARGIPAVRLRATA